MPDDRGYVEQTGPFFLFRQCGKPLMVRVGGAHEQFLAMQDRSIAPIRVATHTSRPATEIHGQGRGKSRMSALSEARVQEQGESVTPRGELAHVPTECVASTEGTIRHEAQQRRMVPCQRIAVDVDLAAHPFAYREMVYEVNEPVRRQRRLTATCRPGAMCHTRFGYGDGSGSGSRGTRARNMVALPRAR